MTGFLVVDKEAGWTSHDVVARCRRVLAERRIGHAGTLDPSATGVLVLGVGRATRLLRFVAGGTKDYRAEVVFGTTTTTLDEEGDPVQRFDMGGLALAEVAAAAAGLTGEIDQQAPMVSAVKVGGRRLHRLARAGVEVEPPRRRVRVERFAVADGSEPGVFAVEVTCSAGTYVRVLAADLGAALGGGAHLRRLRRIRSGPFGEADAHRLEEIAAELAAGRSMLRAPLEALELPSVAVPAELSGLIGHGRPLEGAGLGAPACGPFAVTDGDGQLLAVYEAVSGERLARPAVVLVPS